MAAQVAMSNAVAHLVVIRFNLREQDYAGFPRFFDKEQTSALTNALGTLALQASRIEDRECRLAVEQFRLKLNAAVSGAADFSAKELSELDAALMAANDQIAAELLRL